MPALTTPLNSSTCPTPTPHFQSPLPCLALQSNYYIGFMGAGISSTLFPRITSMPRTGSGTQTALNKHSFNKWFTRLNMAKYNKYIKRSIYLQNCPGLSRNETQSQHKSLWDIIGNLTQYFYRAPKRIKM